MSQSFIKGQYHFIGIGGIGMGALAALLINKGGRVSGSDEKENSMTKALREKGAEVFIGHKKEQIGNADFVIYSSAIKKDNSELTAALEAHIPIIKRGELLAQLMENHIGVTVAGSHGKTTTTSMISNMMITAGLEPTTAVGGFINGPSYNAALGKGKYFVAEVDESDGSFLFFKPHYSVVTNVDFEHVDYYHSWDNILDTYLQFIRQTVKEGTVIIYGNDDCLMGMLDKVRVNVLTYGFTKECHVYSLKRSLSPSGSMFEVNFKDRSLGTFELSIPGEHNILNALACIALGQSLKIDLDIIKSSLLSFKGVKRRLQDKGTIWNINVYDDYGHHPTEIRYTLKTAQTMKKERLVTVFQPHRYTRTKWLFDDFVDALMNTDVLILTDIYAASEPPIDGITSEKLAEAIKQKGHPHALYLKFEDILPFLLNQVKVGDMLLTLGAGDVYCIGEEFLVNLRESSVNQIRS